MNRRQLRSMIRLESVAISVLGAILGIGLGLVFGISLQRGMSGQGITVLSIPAGQLAAFVVVAALVGVLAAVFPARRAARMDVLQAISADQGPACTLVNGSLSAGHARAGGRPNGLHGSAD